MLILSRYPHQVVLIGNDIQVRVLEICKDCGRLGIIAPREIPVPRKRLPADASTPAVR